MAYDKTHHIDENVSRAFNKEMFEAIQTIAAKHGLELSKNLRLTRWHTSENNDICSHVYFSKIEFMKKLNADDAEATYQAELASAFKAKAYTHGYFDSDLGLSFPWGKETATIIGWANRNRKAKLIVSISGKSGNFKISHTAALTRLRKDYPAKGGLTQTSVPAGLLK